MNIVLITDIPPCKNFTAGLVTDILCNFLIEDGHNVSCFSIKNKYVDSVISQDKVDKMKFKIIDKPRENWGGIKFKNLRSYIGNNYVTHFILPKIVRQISAFILENKADAVWFIVQGQVMINLTKMVFKISDLPKLIQIWDPPHWWLKENNVDKFTKINVLRNYGFIIHNADCCIAASWAMAEYYRERYEATCVPVVLGFSYEKPTIIRKNSDDKFIIALSGQQYSINEINALRAALCNMHWEYANKRIILRLYGRAGQYYFSSEENIELRGWLSQEKLIKEMSSEADLLYCPYWFDPEYEQPCRLSFPSKLSTYLKCCLPVLFHGPDYASPRIFLEKYSGAYICDSLEPKIIESVIKKIIDSPNKNDVAQRGYYAFTQELTLEKMKESFITSFLKCGLKWKE